jgi:serine protease
MSRLLLAVALWVALAGWGLAAQTGAESAAESSGAPPAPAAPAARVIVAFRDGAAVTRLHRWRKGAPRSEVRAALQRRAEGLQGHARARLEAGRAVGERAQVVRAVGVSSEALAQRLAAHPDVAWAVVDGWRRLQSAPDDPYFSAGPPVGNGSGGPVAGQWYLRAPDSTFRSAINAQAGWARSTGQDVVVAVLDTGVRFDHPDLQGQLLPGYDLVLDADTAGDGDARDADASDPGDGLSEAEVNTVGGPFFGGAPRFCSTYDLATRRYVPVGSSWHGTEVAGLVAATTGNGAGIAGAAYGAKILPVRVLGKCGGYDSDIQAGMYWAAGIDQPGLPGSSNPARVLNLSLGGSGACSSAYQQAIGEVNARGAVVVVAAGNSTGRAVGTPASCAGVLAVAGLRHAGTKVGFSDLGPQIAIAAPLVSAAAASLLALRPEWGPTEVRQTLQATARAFPAASTDPKVETCHAPDFRDQFECHCTTTLCGAGMLDVDAALVQAAATAGAGGGAGGGGALGWGWLLGLAAAAGLVSARPRRRGG